MGRVRQLADGTFKVDAAPNGKLVAGLHWARVICWDQGYLLGRRVILWPVRPTELPAGTQAFLWSHRRQTYGRPTINVGRMVTPH